MSSSESFTFKILLVGDAGVGKTSFIKRAQTGIFTKKYDSTDKIETCDLTFNTNIGKVVLNIMDIGGQDLYNNVESCYNNADAIIYMFDLTRVESYKNLSVWSKSVINTIGNKPCVVCGNKYDCTSKITIKHIIKIINKFGTYYDISAKSCYNIKKPFITLIRKLIDESVNLIDM